MSAILILYLFILGTCFGSFALATAWRIKKNKDFVRDHSECEKCHHKLAAKDLVPLFSWLSLRGRCRYCRKKITPLLPIAELTGALFFTVSYVFWPYSITTISGLALFGVWCLSLILLLILFFYDLQWYILPNKIIYPLWGIAGLYFVLSFISRPSLAVLLGGVAALAVSSGIFWLIYHASSGKMIGYGDVRLGLAIGLFVGDPIRAGLVLFTASVLGIVVALPSLLKGDRKLNSKVPFGPLLILGLIFVMLFGKQLVDWYTTHILLM